MLPNAHLRALEEGVDTIEKAESRSGWTIGYPGWGLVYHVLLSHLTWDRSNIIVETGTNWGASTIVLAQALIDAKVEGHVHTLEIEPQFAQAARANLERAGVAERVTIHLGDARELLQPVVEGVAAVRIAF